MPAEVSQSGGRVRRENLGEGRWLRHRDVLGVLTGQLESVPRRCRRCR
jgi:hypothetical protein